MSSKGPLLVKPEDAASAISSADESIKATPVSSTQPIVAPQAKWMSKTAARFLFCFLGLQVSYITWVLILSCLLYIFDKAYTISGIHARTAHDHSVYSDPRGT